MVRRRVMMAAAIIAIAFGIGLLALLALGRAQTADGAGGAPAGRLDPARWSDERLTIANLGHSALLMDWFGVRAISDPTLFNRVGLSIGGLFTIGPRRHVPPPLAPAELQNVDVILITHAHMDHLDLPSLRALPKSAVVIACQGCAALIRPLGFNDVRELGWGERTDVKGLRIEAMGARHWGVRWPPFGRAYGYNSYVLERDGVRMLLACDSAYTRMFARLDSDPPDIAAFSIASYDPWLRSHANPEQVWEMFRETGARYLIPLHWGTFRLSKEPMEEPMRRMLAAAGPQADRVVLRRIGIAWSLPKAAERGSQAARLAAPK
jgi:L-ascorbate metabolism protein UlaG (beta-lactamase superfamily)